MGAQDYVAHIIGGFALVAWPAQYGVSDLGHPDKSWRTAP
jgi:hypothetical protein